MATKRRFSRRQKNDCPTEHQEACRFASWLRAEGYAFTHIPAEGTASIGRGIKLRREGLAKGFPDYLVFCGDGLVLGVELKRQRGSKVSPEQREWISKLTELGVPSIIARGADSAIAFVDTFSN